MKFYTSRYRITYTPEGGDPLILLDADDWCNGPLTLTSDIAQQVEHPILSKWVFHHSRGNAQIQLDFTHYGSAASRDAAQLAGFQRCVHLTQHPEGELLLESAWVGPHPQISQRLHATLTRISWQDLSNELSPRNLWLAMSYSFTISPATE